MRISFSKTWDMKTIRNLVDNNSYLQFGAHEDLKALCVEPFAEDETFYTPDYEELVFVVPKEWLERVARELFEVTDLDNWLQNEYTTDESEMIFERALNERQVVMVDFCCKQAAMKRFYMNNMCVVAANLEDAIQKASDTLPGWTYQYCSKVE